MVGIECSRRMCARSRGERGTYRRYVSLYTYTRGQVNALSPPAEAAEEILISRFFVELFLAPPGLPSFALGKPSPHPDTDKSGSEEEQLAAGRPGH